MKTKILILTMCVLAVFTFANCEKDDKKAPENVLVSCNPQTEFVREETNVETVILTEWPKPPVWAYSSFIVLNAVVDSPEPAPYFIQQGGGARFYNKICNYPQWAKDWEIPEEGLPVIISGNIYERSYDVGLTLPEYFYYDMELTSIKKK